MKIATIIGARPQFIKASALSREIQNHSDIEEVIIHTGQHYDRNMSDVFFSELDIPEPKYNLNINSSSHASMTASMLEAIEPILIKENPDLVVVYGDTNSTLAGALASAKLNIKIAHIESGLRSYDNSMPEEINRILTDRVSNFLFCPTNISENNLIKEGYKNIDCYIVNSGDIMFDVVKYYSNRIKNTAGKYVLATIHRQSNTDIKENLINIVEALNEIHKTTKVIIPLHPRTRKRINEFNLKLECEVIDPVGYLDMLTLISNSVLVITDSGGLQKESYFLGKQSVIVREDTEWKELIDYDYSVLSGTHKESIVECYRNIVKRNIPFNKKLYGDGTASKIIIRYLKSKISNT